ncbi:MAG: alpha-hydroxy-acid oxidizing protein [Thermocrispum sp.]
MTQPGNYSDHQLAIYAQGMFADTRPELTTNLARLEDFAREKLSQEAFGYLVPSAGDGATTRANRAAFDRHRIVPRMLRGSKERNYATTVLGTEMPAPVMLAPVGVQNLAHPDGELASVRAAAALGLPYVHSTQASHSFEEVAEAGGDAPRWYQLYWPTDEELCLSFLRRARDSGFSALVLTVDTVLLGYRPADLDRGYLPFLAGDGIANYLSDPVFRGRLAKPPEEDMAAAALQFAQVFPNPGLSWDQLPFLREHWDGPIVLKGIQSADDARAAADAGMDGVVVSNHGGRQVDGAIASLDALGPVAEAVGERLAVLFDSGVRTGSDVVKALALGAQAVMIGRPFVYGLALAGQQGVDHVLRCLLAEFDLSMLLSGRGLPDLNPGVLEG